MQNLFNVTNRKSEEVLDHCAARGIAFIPWYPLAGGPLARPGGLLEALARKLGRTQAQVALSWVLQRSPVVLPIPGTGKVEHLEENCAAAGLTLEPEDFRLLDEAGRGG